MSSSPTSPASHGVSRGRHFSSIALIALSLVLFGAPVAAAVPPASTGVVRIGHAPQVSSALIDLGAVATNVELNAEVELQPADPGALQQFVSAVSTPGSPQYHQYLAKGEFAARFGASPASLRSVAAALSALGLQPGAPDPDGLFLPIHADVATFERALGIGFRRYRSQTGRTVFANTEAPELPRSIAASVSGILGLDNLAIPVSPASATPVLSPSVIPAPAATGAALGSSGAAQPATNGPQPCSTVNISGPPYTAPKLSEAYGINSVYATGDLGAGVTVAIYELEGWSMSPSDTAAFESCYGIDPSVTYEEVDGGPVAGDTESDGVETQLDIDTVTEIAPRANVIVYQGPNSLSEATADGPFDTYKQIVDDDAAKVISTSWSECELDLGYGTSIGAEAENTLFAQAVAQGQTISAASGDDGSEGCNYDNTDRTQLAVQDPAAQPYVTGVGGTTLTSVSTTPPTESAWNAGGGGISQFWPMPSYQSSAPAGLHVINSHSSGTPCAASSGDCREVPDVSADANPNTGYVIDWDGGWYSVGGTSGAAPLWAGLFALADADTTCAVVPLGLANTALYAIAGSSSYSSAFNDVTSGNNDLTGTNGGLFPASSGYDMATGLGSPDAANLIPLLGSPCVASASPAAGVAGQTVTITGEHLLGASAVHFGNAAANPSSISVNASGTSLTVTVPSAPSGSPTTDVTVSTARGVSPTTSSDRFTFNAPTVSGLSPGEGAAGTVVTINGAGFTNATAVNFGATSVGEGGFDVVSDTEITVAAPSGPGGTVDVTVTNAAGSSATSSADHFGYTAAVSSVTPNAAIAGESVTINGSGLSSVTAVDFGATSAPFTPISNTQLDATVPAGPSGTVQVTVVNPVGTSTISNADRFTYGVPVISAVSPSVGAAGTMVAISGSGFANATAVHFGPTLVGSGSFAVLSDSEITLAAPGGVSGTLDLTVSDAAGTSATSAADRFTDGAPIVEEVSPDLGSAGTAVTITGTGFDSETSVSFGEVALNASQFSVASDTTIDATAPSGLAGRVDVTVANSAGTSATTSSDQFTYPPQITGLSAQSGFTVGGTALIISGSGFSTVAPTGGVSFGGVPASYSVLSDSAISVILPSAAPGTVPITVVGSGGSSPESPGSQFTFEPHVSAQTSRLTATPTAVEANGSARATLTVTLTDAFGNDVVGDSVELHAISGHSRIRTLLGISNRLGQATFAVSDDVAESVSYEATDTTAAVSLSARAKVSFGDAPSAALSTIGLAASPRASCPTGSAKATIEVTIRAANGDGLGGRQVSLTAPRSFRGTTSPSAGLTSAGGSIRFVVDDPARQEVTFGARDAPDAVTLQKSVDVSFPAPRRC